MYCEGKPVILRTPSQAQCRMALSFPGMWSLLQPMLLWDSCEDLWMVRGPLPQWKSARHAEVAQLRLEVDGIVEVVRAGDHVVDVAIKPKYCGTLRKLRSLVRTKLLQSSDGQERCTRHAVGHRLQLVLSDLVRLVVTPQDCLETAVLRMYEDLAVHLLDVGDEDVPVPTPSQQHVGERWQKVCPSQQLRVERSTGPCALRAVEHDSELCRRARFLQDPVMRSSYSCMKP
ncbi:uncharacterized protein LOC114929742 [Nylanderia fulva]|uniref:uncharacterized protein LOC114929742 n=2 Tax=Nylanderia fulva TaxID=613905 RepID=UPI0010FB7536|nr:uncharacterized protein LOC114929742 [Nylanderia fulva]XP_029157241.1 uncharacterized protein LOC114929742 [Nylanderia fulva]